MIVKAIKNSPGYYITDIGEVYNENGKNMKTWVSADGYKRIRLFSIEHNKRVNRTVHLLMACEFLGGGRYVGDSKLQVNHIDGNKLNNHISNLELISGTDNVNHAHENNLYTYDLRINVRDIVVHKNIAFRSLRELARYLEVSMNYIRPRIPISAVYPIFNRYILSIDYDNYIKHISTIKNNKTIYVYSHITNTEYVLTSYTQISILFGISDINISVKLSRLTDMGYYIGGYTFRLSKHIKLEKITKETAVNDRKVIWKKLAMNNLNNVGPKRVGLQSLKSKRQTPVNIPDEDIVSSII